MYKEALEDFLALKKDMTPEELDKVAEEMLKAAGDLEDSDEDPDKKKDKSDTPEEDEDGNAPVLNTEGIKTTMTSVKGDEDVEGAKQKSEDQTPSDTGDQVDTENKVKEDDIKEDQDDKEYEDSKRAAETILGEMNKVAEEKEKKIGPGWKKGALIGAGVVGALGAATGGVGSGFAANLAKDTKKIVRAKEAVKGAAGVGALAAIPGAAIGAGVGQLQKNHNENMNIKKKMLAQREKSASELIDELYAEKLAETREKTASEILDELVFKKATEGMNDTEKVAFSIVNGYEMEKEANEKKN